MQHILIKKQIKNSLKMNSSKKKKFFLWSKLLHNKKMKKDNFFSNNKKSSDKHLAKVKNFKISKLINMVKRKLKKDIYELNLK